MGGFGFSLTTGFSTILEQRVAVWLISLPEFQEQANLWLEETSPHDFALRAGSAGSKEAVGRALVSSSQEQGKDRDWLPGRAEFFSRLIAQNSFLAQNYQVFDAVAKERWERAASATPDFFDKKWHVLFGEFVLASKWWTAHKKEINKTLRDNKAVKEVLTS